MPERYNVTIKELPLTERPRERLMMHGAHVCTAAELLAIQLGTGTRERSALGVADQLISYFQGVGGVAAASVDALCAIKGVGPVKAIEIASAFELGRRLSAVDEDYRPTITSPQDVANLLMPELRDEKREHMKALLLDTKARVMRSITVSIGSLDSSIVHPREVFRRAIECAAASIVIAHNHPSGDPTPSREDRLVTERLNQAAGIIGITLLDHVILGHNRWVSLKAEGIL